MTEEMCKIAPIFYSMAAGSEERILRKTYRDGTSFIAYFLSETNSKYHRVDGPAVQWFIYGEDKPYCEFYYILGKEITEEQFNTPGFVDAFIMENS